MAQNANEHRRAESPSTADELSGSFGRYRIVRRLGRGTMGTVYLAADTMIERQVALKIPHLGGQESKAIEIARFQQEARSAARLQHPNICTVYDFGEVDGVIYLTMPYIDGRPMSEAMRQRKATPAKSIEQVQQIARAMAYAHRHGVIHRDLKPANIMIDRADKPVIMDFGLARRLDLKTPRLTVLGDSMGTLSYMSPEQLRGEVRDVGVQSDVYSLGAILYEVLSGHCPFEGSFAEIVGKLLNEDPKPISELAPELRGTRLESILQKSLAKGLADRFLSMDAFADALTHALAREERMPEPTAVHEIPTASAERGSTSSTNWRAAEPKLAKAGVSWKLLIDVAAVAVLASAVAALWWFVS